MNISLDAFTKLCAEHIRQHEPILAYRHSSGWGLLKLYTVTPEPSYIITGTTIAGKAYVMRAETSAERDRLLREARQKSFRIDKIEEIPGKERKAKAATVKAMRGAINKMRKSWHTSGLCFVEYDGQSVQAEGDLSRRFVEAMQEAMQEAMEA